MESRVFVKVKKWIIDKERRVYTYCDGIEIFKDEDEYYKVAAVIEKETEKAVYASIQTNGGGCSFWKMWLPKSQIIVE